jgi:hypothetical protein
VFLSNGSGGFSVQGTNYVYSSLLKPLVATHEGEIDRYLNELSTRAGDVAYQYWAKGSEFAQSRVMELVQNTMAQASRASRQEGSVSPSWEGKEFYYQKDYQA